MHRSTTSVTAPSRTNSVPPSRVIQGRAEGAGTVPLLSDMKASVPIWAVRPGTADCVRGASRGMPVWLLIRSCNGMEMTSCYLSETSLAKGLGYLNRAPVRTQLKKLRDVRGLLLEIPLGRKKGTPRFLSSVRFATEPVRLRYWFPVIANRRLPALAEQFNLGLEWLEGAQARLAAHARASVRLVDHLKYECYDSDHSSPSLWPPDVQDAGEGGREGAYSLGTDGSSDVVGPKRPRRKRRRRKKEQGRGVRSGSLESAAMLPRVEDMRENTGGKMYTCHAATLATLHSPTEGAP